MCWCWLVWSLILGWARPRSRRCPGVLLRARRTSNARFMDFRQFWIQPLLPWPFLSSQHHWLTTISVSDLPATHMMPFPVFWGKGHSNSHLKFMYLIRAPDLKFTLILHSLFLTKQTADLFAPQWHETAAMLVHLSNLSIAFTFPNKDNTFLSFLSLASSSTHTSTFPHMNTTQRPPLVLNLVKNTVEVCSVWNDI